MKKIIKLRESDLRRIVKRVISEQLTGEKLEQKVNEIMNIEKPDNGQQYCFSKNKLREEIGNQGHYNIGIHKIKKGQGLNHLKQLTMQHESLITMNPKCDLNKPKIGDVIIYSKLPSM